MVSTNNAAQQMSHQQIAMQQQAIAHDRELAKRRSRKPTDLNISQEIQDLVPGGDQYGKLRDFERRLDAVMMRKRLDVQEAARNYKVCLLCVFGVFLFVVLLAVLGSSFNRWRC